MGVPSLTIAIEVKDMERTLKEQFFFAEPKSSARAYLIRKIPKVNISAQKIANELGDFTLKASNKQEEEV
jgi:hypothetical protein